MGVRCETQRLFYHSFNMEAINPEYLGISEEAIREYMKEHPKPDDPYYSTEDMIYDLTDTSGFLSLSDNVSEETATYMCEMIEDLM